MILDERYRQWAVERTDEAREALFAEIRRHAMRQAHDDDLTQDVCITIMDKLERFKPIDAFAFTRYVSSVTTIHRMKKAVAHRFEEWNEDQETAAQENEFISISELEPFTQTVATMILEGNSLEDTATSLGLKPPTLRKKLQRMRHKNNPSTDKRVEGQKHPTV